MPKPTEVIIKRRATDETPPLTALVDTKDNSAFVTIGRFGILLTRAEIEALTDLLDQVAEELEP